MLSTCLCNTRDKLDQGDLLGKGITAQCADDGVDVLIRCPDIIFVGHVADDDFGAEIFERLDEVAFAFDGGWGGENRDAVEM